ncbi:MAG: hypothetical protein JO089_08465, partial [Alphaproteobacteria bacterium]|nr:hypothetical protein [Alphaproteobacteria bacterium]
MNPELSALGERRAAIGEPAEINVSVERIFLWLVIPLTVFYLLTINPLRDFYHGTERYLHVSYLAHLAAGGERGTLPSGFVRMAMAGRPEVLPPLYSDLLPQWRARGLEMPALAPDDRSIPRLWPLRVIAL